MANSRGFLFASSPHLYGRQHDDPDKYMGASRIGCLMPHICVKGVEIAIEFS